MAYQPILIGSQALKIRGIDFTTSKSDYDLIVKQSDAYRIAYYADSRLDTNIFKYGDKTIELHIWNEGDTNHKIWELLNRIPYSNEKNIEISSKLGAKLNIIVAGLYALYIIKKSHIHRILPITNNNNSNITIWRRHVNMYNKMRQELAKEYDSYVDIDKPNDDPFRECLQKVLLERIKEVNNRVGDAKNIENAELSSFFKDNVPRVIDHDLLHEKVAAMFDENWEKEGLLFKKFLKNESDVAMDKDLFMSAEPEKRNMVIIQEIAVLYLERKWLPAIKKDLDVGVNIKANKYDNDDDLQEIISHYITNLAGSDWLRMYAIEHYDIIASNSFYNEDGLWKIAMSIFGDRVNDAKCKAILTMSNLMASGTLFPRKLNINPNKLSKEKIDGEFMLNCGTDKSYGNIRNNYKVSRKSIKGRNSLNISIVPRRQFSGDDVKFNTFNIKGATFVTQPRKIYLHSNVKLQVPSNSAFDANSKLFSLIINEESEYLFLMNDFKDERDYSYDYYKACNGDDSSSSDDDENGDFSQGGKYVIYNLDNSTGIVMDNNVIVSIFALKIEIETQLDFWRSIEDITNVSCRVFMTDIDGIEIISDKTKYNRDYHTSYYRSYGCTESSEYASRTSGEYLATYGRINNEMLGELCEYIARVLLNQYFDSGKANSDDY